MSEDYFTYKDCPEHCQRKLLSCSIEEFQSGRFEYDCYREGFGCLDKATRKLVCVTPSQAAKGKEDIWNDFYKSHHPKQPAHFAGGVVAAICILLIGIGGILVYRKRRGYQSLDETRDYGYEDTTINL